MTAAQRHQLKHAISEARRRAVQPRCIWCNQPLQGQKTRYCSDTCKQACWARLTRASNEWKERGRHAA